MVAKSIMASIPQMPYALRLMAREALFALRVRYQCDDSLLWPVVAKAVVMPFILPAIAAPETYGIAENVNPVMRRNLNAIAHLLGLIASQDLGLTVKDRLVREPLQEYIRVAGKEMSDFIFDVAEVDFQVQEMLESTSEATPISITRKDIYGLLAILIRHQQTITAGKPKDPIESVLDQLEGPPIDYDRSNATVRVRLTNRLAQLQTSDPEVARNLVQVLAGLDAEDGEHVALRLRLKFTDARDLWVRRLKLGETAYLHYIRRQNPGDGPDPAATRTTVIQAYEYALKECGVDRESGEIWQEYISYLTDFKSKNPWEQQQNTDNVRKLLQYERT
ncbi:cytoskeletal protein binding protein [Trichosporon asahii var. asahii CBS 8904]|uniref:Cytoskeletal protein binding protein n=1 Tax=Trichosporon asahii var. asahii (strain CBS 8904) TaxID=1220162 RepID=K1VV75_TRIAC|nr:cytoskeletal protein binding protein [Trichosporon asahii var. asahii CBS 8904]